MTPPKATRWAAVLLVPAFLLSGCAGTTPTESANFGDIHGMAVDPADSTLLHVATHHGLFEGRNDQGWKRIGDEIIDLMGFSMNPTDPNVMFASGHPSSMSRDDWAVGLIRSDDAGRTWRTLSLRNEVDFHAMTVSLANPNHVYGWYYRDAQFYSSKDGGTTWTKRPTPSLPAVYALASSPVDESTVFAGTKTGLYRSTDEGRSWAPWGNGTAGKTVAVIAATRADPNLVWAYAASGPVRTTDGGASWSRTSPIPLASDDGPAALAIDPADTSIVYFGSGMGAIYKTTNSGRTWELVKGLAG